MSGPALPWASEVKKDEALTGDNVTDSAEPKESVEYLTLEAVGVDIGRRIEVKWQVDNDEGSSYMRWWGAKIVGVSSEQDAEHPGAPVYEIEYDAQDGFEQEHSHIIFVGEHDLYQLDVSGELLWRREGDPWDAEDEDDEEEEGAGDGASEGETILTMDHVKQMMERDREYLDGKSLEEAEGELLGKMEPSKRIAVAAGFRDFADNLMSFLRSKLADSEDGSVTVTEEHVRAFTETMRKKQRTG